MDTNKDGGFENYRDRNRSPNANGKPSAARDSSPENSDVETNDKGEQACHGERGEEMEHACKEIAATSLRPPRHGCRFLITMEDDAHPKPTGEDRNNAGDEAWSERGTQRVHFDKSNMSILTAEIAHCR